MPGAELFPYVYVNADGTARELHPSERQHLQSDFRPGDGAAPYVKCSYTDRNGWGELTGYLERSESPPRHPNTTSADRRPRSTSR